MNRWLPRLWSLVILAITVGAGSLHAQDTTSAPTDSSWNYNFGPFNVNGPVHRIAVAPNGDVYIGGEFTTVNGVNANRIAKWNGTTWSALGAGIGNGSVHAIAFNGANVYVGGRFGLAGTVNASNIAQWNGSAWSFMGKRENEQGLDPTVTNIVFVGNNMYVSGSFIYGGNNDMLNRVARWNSAERIFVPLEGVATRGLDDTVFAMVALGDELYVGGKFPNAGGATAARVAKWDITDQTWSKLGNGVGQQGSSTASVTTLAIKDSILYVGGDFTFAGGRAARRVAKWSLVNESWSALIAATGGNGVDSTPTTMAVDERGNLYVGGPFMIAGLDSARRIAKWNNTDRDWSPLASGLNGIPYSLAPQGKHVYVGGAFTQAGNKNSPYLARWFDSLLASVQDTTTDTTDTTTISVALVVDHASAKLTTAPNPTRGSSTISFTLPNSGYCTIDIQNVHGETVATLVDERLNAGPYNVRWNATGLPDGMYFCRLRSRESTQTTKVVLVR